jgi:hypothetical protein
MTGPRKPHEVVSGVLDWAEHDEETTTKSDVDDELAAAGADVPGFLARVRERITEVEEHDRLSWREEARRKIAAQTQMRTGRYDALDHAALVAEVSRRQTATAGAAQAFFHKLEELTDEDLRTLLEDQDALEGQ